MLFWYLLLGNPGFLPSLSLESDTIKKFLWPSVGILSACVLCACQGPEACVVLLTLNFPTGELQKTAWCFSQNLFTDQREYLWMLMVFTINWV